MELILECNAICTKVHKKSTIAAFKNIKVGDFIRFTCKLTTVGCDSEGRTHAKYVNVKNNRTNQESDLSFNQLKVLKNFDFMPAPTGPYKEKCTLNGLK